MTKIPFTRFTPSGRGPIQTEDPFDCHDPEIAKAAEFIREAGGRFTVEVLTTGMVSVACEYNFNDGEGYRDIAIELAPVTAGIEARYHYSITNNPEILDAIAKMIRTAHKIVLDPASANEEPA